MSRPFPRGRVGFKEFLQQAAITKNTFFRRYRHVPHWIRVLDIQEDRDHRLHFPETAGSALRALRGKKPHGNTGRPMGRICVGCGARVHPRLARCRACGHAQPVQQTSNSTKPRRSTAVLNGQRREKLERMRAEAAEIRDHPPTSAPGSTSDSR